MTTPAGAVAPGRRVVLVHGLWMTGLAMRWFASRLREAGHQPVVFSYRSIVGGPVAAARHLADVLRAGGPADIVAHSLGGLIALEALALEPALPVRRLLCLGVPLAGSGAAASLSRWPLLPLWLGRSGALLQRGCRPWPATLEVAMVAGSVPRGLGGLFAHFAQPHDGTVSVAETRAPGLVDHVVVQASHSGLLFSREAARQAVAFLRDGAFARGGEAGTAGDHGAARAPG